MMDVHKRREGSVGVGYCVYISVGSEIGGNPPVLLRYVRGNPAHSAPLNPPSE
jgi:hypothetical protein